jgi:hypothetical protein
MPLQQKERLAEYRKPLLVFGTPRSGTRIFTSTIGQFLQENHQIEPLGEFLATTDRYDVESPAGRFRFWKEPSAEDLERVHFEKVETLRSRHGKVFLKVFPNHLSQVASGWLIENYEWIFVERRDLFDQLLSYLISSTTREWYKEGGLQFVESSLRADLDDIQKFVELHASYVRMKARLRPSRVAVYEDVVAEKGKIAQKVLDISGLRALKDFHPRLPEKQNQGNKLRYFENRNAIIGAYRNSPLFHFSSEIS